jgi:large subunit ribosomal protein L35
MPKMKTKRGAKKRLSMTKSGKFKAKKSKLRHILSTKSRKQKRRLKEPLYISKADEKRVNQMLPYGA